MGCDKIERDDGRRIEAYSDRRFITETGRVDLGKDFPKVARGDAYVVFDLRRRET